MLNQANIAKQHADENNVNASKIHDKIYRAWKRAGLYPDDKSLKQLQTDCKK